MSRQIKGLFSPRADNGGIISYHLGSLYGGRPTERHFNADRPIAGRDLYRLRGRSFVGRGPGGVVFGDCSHIRRNCRGDRGPAARAVLRRRLSALDRGAPALLCQAPREERAERHRRNRAQAGTNFLVRRAPQFVRPLAMDLAGVLGDGQQLRPVYRRVDDDRLRLQFDVAQLRHLPRRQHAARRSLCPAEHGDGGRRRVVSSRNCRRHCAPRPLHERLVAASESQFQRGDRRAAASRDACGAIGHRPQQYVARSLHAGRERSPYPDERPGAQNLRGRSGRRSRRRPCELDSREAWSSATSLLPHSTLFSRTLCSTTMAGRTSWRRSKLATAARSNSPSIG